MKKLDRVPREVLQGIYERGERFFKQKELAESCDLSLGTINPLIQKLRRLGAIERKPQGFRVIDVDRLLTYWSVTRDLPKDVAYSTYVPRRVGGIETDLPKEVILTAYSGYVKYFGEAPSSYRGVYLYGDSRKIERRFRPRPEEEPNLFVLDSDDHLEGLSSGGVVPLPQLYVDLWQLGRPANRFLKELEWKMKRRAIRGLKRVAKGLGRKS